MHDLIRRMSSHRSGAGARYGIPILAVAVAVALRLLAPLDVAPFLLFMPIVFLVALALGRQSGLFALVLTTVAAAYLFVRDDAVPTLLPSEIVALVQYIVVAGAMILICGALRKAFVDTENAVARLDEANRFLSANREHLDAARREALDAKETAEAANAAKSEFLANMSHELRTPLSAIIGYSEMMAEEIGDGCAPDDLSADLDKIEGNARHLLGLINDVLDLSKVESGKMEVFVEEFDIEDLLRELADTAGALVAKKGNQLDLQMSKGLGQMRSDLTKTRQILLNFLSNAAKFTTDGTVTLAASRRTGPDGADWISFTVADTGIGMTDEQVSRLFRRFEQADASTTRRFGGTGLGLSLTRALVSMLDGKVLVTSTHGQGTAFTVNMPAEYQPTELEVASPAPDVIDDVAEDEVILAIDDDRDQLALTTRFLHREGFKVQTAIDGKKGIELAHRLKPRAILLDVMMPGIDGWSVLSQIKNDEALSSIPVIMVTAVDQRNLAASLGASDYLLKPVDWARFSKVIEPFKKSQSDRPGTVLLIEDEATVRLDVRSMLEDEGWAVVDAANGADGLALAASSPPDMVITDLSMPVMDGFEFLPKLREIPACKDIPVIVLTGRGLSPEDRRRLRGASQILNAGDLDSARFVDRLRSLTAPASTAAP